MKLFELATPKPSKQAAKVFESYFGDSINVDIMSTRQARTMLGKVRKLISEHKQTKAAHHREQNPAYNKLMMMERVLIAKIKEDPTVPVGGVAGAQQNVNNAQKPGTTTQTPQQQQMAKQQQQAQLSKIQNPQLKTAMQKAASGQTLNPQDQQLVAQAALQTESINFRRSLYHILRESEVQQAQVVLAAQDMVDKIQKMLEDVGTAQFKDLPALVDQIKNQVGVDQAMQFNTEVTAALSGLVQNLQATKLQLDQSLNVVTGQEMPGAMPGADMGAGMAGELPPEEDMPDDMGGEEMPDEGNPFPDADEPEMSPDLGRGKRK